MNPDSAPTPRRRRVIVRTAAGVHIFEGAVPAAMRRRIDAALRDGSASVSFREPSDD